MLDDLRPKTIALIKAIGDLSIKGAPPTLDELGEALGFKSSISVRYHLNFLEKEGLVYPRPHKTPRCTVLTPAGKAYLKRLKGAAITDRAA